MTNLDHLAEVMATQAELTEQLVDVMKHQQQALVKLDSVTVETTVEREQELLLPIEGLEQERARLTKEIFDVVAPLEVTDESPISLSRLLIHLNNEEANRLSSIGNRLHNAVQQMLNLSQANGHLIEHSRKFVRETFRIVTNGYSRQLVDQKI